MRGVIGSSSPQTISVGWRIVHSHGRLVQPTMGTIRYIAARRELGRRMCMPRMSSGWVRIRPPNMSPATCCIRSGW